jgi:hypothetical protein
MAMKKVDVLQEVAMIGAVSVKPERVRRAFTNRAYAVGRR